MMYCLVLSLPEYQKQPNISQSIRHVSKSASFSGFLSLGQPMFSSQADTKPTDFLITEYKNQAEVPRRYHHFEG
jgi:hypothetical protein